ncbi:MAG TPA: hypothetical protein VEB21_14490 [Terriglobales bacterium]|nr:hypothetical protein [Terriglobales bacterium]
MKARRLKIEKSSDDASVVRQRIDALKERLNELADGKAVFGTMADTPPEVEEAFLRSVLEFEEQHKARRR